MRSRRTTARASGAEDAASPIVYYRPGPRAQLRTSAASPPGAERHDPAAHRHPF